MRQLVLGVLLALGLVTRATAADAPLPAQPNPDIFQYQGQPLNRFNSSEQQLRRTGVWQWDYVQVNGCASTLSFVVEVLDGVSRQTGIFMVYAPGTGHKFYSSCGPTLDSICGTGASAGNISCLNRPVSYTHLTLPTNREV